MTNLTTDDCRLIGAALAYYASHASHLAEQARAEGMLDVAQAERRDARIAARLGYHFDVADEAEVR